MDPHFILSTYTTLNEWMKASHEPGIVVMQLTIFLGAESFSRFLIGFPFLFFLLAILGFELRLSPVLGRCSTTLAMSPAPFLLKYFSNRGSHFCLQLALGWI
jgi:hypothetical protein